jgi:hypothetical protein
VQIPHVKADNGNKEFDGTPGNFLSFSFNSGINPSFYGSLVKLAGYVKSILLQGFFQSSDRVEFPDEVL